MSGSSDPAEAPRRATLVSNERTKLTATYVNGIAIAVLAVGGLAPIFARPQPTLGVAVSSALCVIVSAALHWRARGHLKELR